MRNPLDRRDGLGTLLNAAAAVLVAVAVNGVIGALGLNGPPENLREPAFAPPGWFIGGMWVVLFALMGAARWAAVRDGDRGGGWWVVGLLAICVAYPFYTRGFELTPSMAGNVATLAAAIAVALRLRRTSRTAALLIVPVVAWVAFACVLAGTQIAIN